MISAQVGLPATPPDAPGLFRCAAPDAIGRVFRDTGMHDVAETDVHGFSEPASAEDLQVVLRRHFSSIQEQSPAVKWPVLAHRTLVCLSCVQLPGWGRKPAAPRLDGARAGARAPDARSKDAEPGASSPDLPSDDE